MHPSVEEKENECAGTQSLGGIEKALLETNKLLKGVLHRVDKCEKQDLLRASLRKV